MGWVKDKGSMPQFKDGGKVSSKDLEKFGKRIPKQKVQKDAKSVNKELLERKLRNTLRKGKVITSKNVEDRYRSRRFTDKEELEAMERDKTNPLMEKYQEGGKAEKKKLKTGIYDTSDGSSEMIHKPIPRDEAKYKVNIQEGKYKVDTGKYGSWKDNTPSDAGVKDYWKSKRKDTSSKYKVPKIEKKYNVDKGMYSRKKTHKPGKVDEGVKDYWKSKKYKATLEDGGKVKKKNKKTKKTGKKNDPADKGIKEYYEKKAKERGPADLPLVKDISNLTEKEARAIMADEHPYKKGSDLYKHEVWSVDQPAPTYPPVGRKKKKK